MITAVPVFSGLGSGTYNIHIVDNKRCYWNKKIYIENPDAIILSLGNDLVMLLGESVEIEPGITPTDDYEYFWSPPAGLSCTYCSHAIAAPVENTVYKLQILNNNGCAASDSILIRITVPDGNIYAPNIFSPGDGRQNTTFTVFGDAVLVEETEWLRIYDRWGSLVYEGKHLQPDNPNDGWDGSCRNKPSSSGIYLWQASIRFKNGNVVLKKGDVMLLR
jgi:gliding motility-associated-like protein